MDFERIESFLRQNIVPVLLGSLGLILILFGFFQYISSSNNQESSVVFEEGNKEEKTKIIIDIEGAVINPGVYTLSSDARTLDALAAAGGLSEDADRIWVEKNINLAKRLSDGVKIYIPRMGEQVLSEINQTTGTGGAVININTASITDLDSLPGVGVVTSQKIVDGRPYGQIEELLSKKIVGQATFEKIKDKISAN